MNTKRRYASLLALAVAAFMVVSACGGGSDSSPDGSGPGGSSAAPTLSVDNIDGVGEVLVDAEGSALYAADEEADGMVLCTEACAAIWEPLTTDAGSPTADDGLDGRVGVVERPDGGRQVTFDGRLLYRFIEDPSPGTVTGNGFSDTFEGQPFTWHVATPTGVSASSANSTSSSDGYDF
jgi:predicted lipoprotein with Yx(FWY)xxD motif